MNLCSLFDVALILLIIYYDRDIITDFFKKTVTTMTATASYKHILANQEATWQATVKQWKLDAKKYGDEGVFLEQDLERRLNAAKASTGKDINHYFVVKKGDTVASSLLETSHAMSRSSAAWLKLLNITLRPSLLVDPDNLREAFTVLAASITHSIDLIFQEHPSKELKIYGRTTEMRNLFRAIVSAGKIDSVLEKYKLNAKIAGTWLVLEKRSR